jgi:hypothetical protein
MRIPLTKHDHQIALCYSAEQENTTKGKLVFNNTIAVLSVHKCLKWVGFNSKLETTETWHPGLRTLFNCNDLDLPNGKIDCIPVLPGQDKVTVPTVWNIEQADRIGYAFVQFSSHMNTSEIIGFLPKEGLKLKKLQTELVVKINKVPPFETIFDYVSADHDIIQS